MAAWPPTEADGNNGAFLMPGARAPMLQIIASDGKGWEHVSVMVLGAHTTPSWDEMCFVKGLFWDDDDCVIQYHPPRENYVNCHPNVLHLWRPIGQEIPQPPSILVGPKT